jgi:2-dehydropantoate 2-reductase
MKVLIFGAGALGSLIGAFLTLAKTDVTLLGRGPHIETVNKRGLIVDLPNTPTLNIDIRTVSCVEELKETFDLILLTVKAYDTENAAKQIKHLLNDDETLVLSLQNGIEPFEILADYLSPNNVLIGTTMISSSMINPGCVRSSFVGETILGEFTNKITPRIIEVAEIFKSAKLPTRITTNSMRELWIKLLVNSTANPLSYLLGTEPNNFGNFEEVRVICDKIINEGLTVAERKGIKVSKETIQRKVERVFRVNIRPSMLQDLFRNKRPEVEYINGYIVKQGRKNKIDTPYNDMIVKLVMSQYYLKNVKNNLTL